MQFFEAFLQNLKNNNFLFTYFSVKARICDMQRNWEFLIPMLFKPGSKPLTFQILGKTQFLCMSKSTTVNKYGFTPFANGRCQVFYSQQEYISTFSESICIYKFNECIPENVLIIWVLVYFVEISICILCFNKNDQTKLSNIIFSIGS